MVKKNPEKDFNPEDPPPGYAEVLETIKELIRTSQIIKKSCKKKKSKVFASEKRKGK